MKFFLDSANLDEIDRTLARGLISGLTTNPTHLRGQIDSNPLGHIHKIIDIFKKYNIQIPLSVQVMTTNAQSMLEQAEKIVKKCNYRDIVIKIPCGWNEFKVIHSLAKKGIKVNCTACMTYSQAMLGAASGARYVSLFYGKMGDAGLDAKTIVKDVARSLRHSWMNCELIVGSIRKPYDISEILLCGADIVTVPYRYFEILSQHSKTEEAINSFASNFLELDD